MKKTYIQLAHESVLGTIVSALLCFACVYIAVYSETNVFDPTAKVLLTILASIAAGVFAMGASSGISHASKYYELAAKE